MKAFTFDYFATLKGYNIERDRQPLKRWGVGPRTDNKTERESKIIKERTQMRETEL